MKPTKRKTTETIIIEVYNDNTATIRSKNKVKNIIVNTKRTSKIIIDFGSVKHIIILNNKLEE
jgi:hypothetical protein